MQRKPYLRDQRCRVSNQNIHDGRQRIQEAQLTDDHTRINHDNSRLDEGAHRRPLVQQRRRCNLHGS